MQRMRLVCLSVLVLLAVASCIPATDPISPLPTATLPVGSPPGIETPLELPRLELSGTGIAAIVAFLLSIALQYGSFSTWWSGFAYKREALAGVGLVVAWVLVGLHYLGVVDILLGPFGWLVVRRVFEAWLTFAGAGQLMYTAQHAASRWIKGAAHA